MLMALPWLGKCFCYCTPCDAIIFSVATYVLRVLRLSFFAVLIINLKRAFIEVLFICFPFADSKTGWNLRLPGCVSAHRKY
jgi:hypothetical protein